METAETHIRKQCHIAALEAQLESEHEERTQLLKEKHELERRLGALEEAGRAVRATDEDQLHRLRKDLRRTKALLRDAQTQLERSRGDSPGKAILRQLRNQVHLLSYSFTLQNGSEILEI
jgi:myosin-18